MEEVTFLMAPRTRYTLHYRYHYKVLCISVKKHSQKQYITIFIHCNNMCCALNRELSCTNLSYGYTNAFHYLKFQVNTDDRNIGTCRVYELLLFVGVYDKKIEK